jgi:hypothetical protein
LIWLKRKSVVALEQYHLTIFGFFLLFFTYSRSFEVVYRFWILFPGFWTEFPTNYF